jgi:hypothetical protein
MISHSRGFVYAATGPQYTTLARRSARNLRAIMPDAQIDLFTDRPVKDSTFNRIIPLSETWFRPKMEALLRSRFDRTVLLDADTIPVMDLSEMFAAVDACDLAGCMSKGRPMAMYRHQSGIPRAFPFLNAGVLVIKRSARTQAMIREWQAMLRLNSAQKDQPALRWLLHQRRVTFAVLPPEYNLTHIRALDAWEMYFAAPRLLHVQDLHKNPPGNALKPFNLDRVLGQERAKVVRRHVRLEKARGALPLAEFPDPMGQPLAAIQRTRLHLNSHFSNAKGLARAVLRHAKRRVKAILQR